MWNLGTYPEVEYNTRHFKNVKEHHVSHELTSTDIGVHHEGHHTATRLHRVQFRRTVRPAGKVVEIEVCSLIRFVCVKGLASMEIHCQWVSGANVKSKKKLWICYSAVDNGRTDVDDKQGPGQPNTSSTYDSVQTLGGWAL